MEIISSLYKDIDKEVLDINIFFFKVLLDKYQSGEEKTLVLKDDKNNEKVVPLPIANDNETKCINIQYYSELSDNISPRLKSFGLKILKMQAGLGTSVKRDDLILKYDNRSTLGSKGTDLFINIDDQMVSIAEAQLLKAININDKDIYKYIAFQNLINSETEVEVNKIWNHKYKFQKTSYSELFSTESLKRYKEIYQLMMPTIDETNNLTTERLAPAGHAFLGFFEIFRIFKSTITKDEIICIGNGEDLQSTTDEKIHSWMVEQKLPIVMVTTTKTHKDKKGGQIAIVNEDLPYVTIIEKAQAEESNQLGYFEDLGLREGDRESLFNTNIVLINEVSLKNALEEINVSDKEFIKILSPDVIKNVKEQNGKKYIQLEGAIGSVLLNLDMFYRKKFGRGLVSFLNLNELDREKFFVPIKKREDFDQIYNN